MRRSLGKILLLLLLSAACFAEMTFDEFTQRFNKTYSTVQQRNRRRDIYNANVLQIQEHNANPHATYQLTVTPFADKTDAELVRPKLPKVDLSRAVNGMLPRIGGPLTNIPDSFSWKDKGKVSAVKDQSKCGACWVFVATATVESFIAIQTGSLYDLSNQYVLECTALGDCVGGFVELAFQKMMKGNIPLEFTYRYTAGFVGNNYDRTPGICSANQGIAFPDNSTINTYYNISHQRMQELILNGPVAAMFHGTERAFSFYSTGVYTCGIPTVTEDLLDHALEVIGWDNQSNWIVKNSWGTSWGSYGIGVVSKDYDCGLRLIVFELRRNGGGPLPSPVINPPNRLEPSQSPISPSPNSTPTSPSNSAGSGYIINFKARIVVVSAALLTLMTLL